MSKESVFSLQSWASLEAVRVEAAFSGVEEMFASSLATWGPASSFLWLADWRSADSSWGSGPELLHSGQIRKYVTKTTQKIKT